MLAAPLGSGQATPELAKVGIFFLNSKNRSFLTVSSNDNPSFYTLIVQTCIEQAEDPKVIKKHSVTTLFLLYLTILTLALFLEIRFLLFLFFTVSLFTWLELPILGWVLLSILGISWLFYASFILYIVLGPRYEMKKKREQYEKRYGTPANGKEK